MQFEPYELERSRLQIKQTFDTHITNMVHPQHKLATGLETADDQIVALLRLKQLIEERNQIISIF